MRAVLPVAFLFCINIAFAQTGKFYSVKVGEVPNEVLPVEAMYLLPHFTAGTAFMRDGSSAAEKFNYNFLLDEMHFITAGGDTLAISEPLLLKSVVIDSMVFYYDKGYVRQIFERHNYKLALKQQMVQVADKTRGAYDAASGASSIKTYGIINNNGQIYQLQVKKDVFFREVISFYFSDAFNHFLKASKKNFMTVFPKEDLSKYLKQHKVNFNNEADLKALLQFCAE